MKEFRNILVVTDFSRDSQSALDEAVAMAERFGSTVYLLHAVDKIQDCAVDYCLSEEQVMGEKNKLMGEAKRKLEKEIGRFKGVKTAAIIPDLRYGHTYEEILEEEREKNIDLLVIGPHPKKTIAQRLFKHLSDKLVVNSVCDTLVVRHAAL